jgi:hypothetical protein
MLPSMPQQYAIQARLNFMLGAEIYDRLFPGFVCGPILEGTVSVFVEDQDRASVIAAGYSWHVAAAVESVLKRAVRQVNVLPQENWRQDISRPQIR